MHVLQAGVAKSGNYWLWRIIAELLDEAGIPKHRFVAKQPIYREIRKGAELSHADQAESDVIDVVRNKYYWRISSLHRERIEDVRSYVEQCTQLWTHSAWASGCRDLLSAADKVVYIVRDPRDVAISMANFAFTPYVLRYYPHRERSVSEYLEGRIEWQLRSWVRHVSGWLANAGERTHVLFYETLKVDLLGQLGRLAEYLELPLDSSALGRVARAVSVDRMKRQSPNHVRDGQSGGWRDVLRTEQIALAAATAGHLLSQLGYPLDPHTHSLPSLRADTRQECARIYASSGLRGWDWFRATYSLLRSRRTLADKIHVVKRQFAAMRQR